MGTVFVLVAMILVTLGTTFIYLSGSREGLSRVGTILGIVYLWLGAYVAGWLSGDSLLTAIFWMIVGGEDV